MLPFSSSQPLVLNARRLRRRLSQRVLWVWAGAVPIPIVQLRFGGDWSIGAVGCHGHRGSVLIEQLVARGLVLDVADLCRLTQVELESAQRIGEKSARNFLAGLEKSKSQDLWRLLFGLGILHVGRRCCQNHLSTCSGHASSDVLWSPRNWYPCRKLVG